MHPEIAPIASTLPTLDLEDVPAARAFMAQLTGQADRARPEGLSVVDRTLAAPDGREIGVRVYRREDRARPPALVYFHGGAFSTGDLDTEDAACVRYALEAGCAVVSVDYRLAPEHPYPAGLEDCFAALGAVAEQADELDLDRERLAVGGGSTGAGLAAAVALLVRDRRRNVLDGEHLGPAEGPAQHSVHGCSSVELMGLTVGGRGSLIGDLVAVRSGKYRALAMGDFERPGDVMLADCPARTTLDIVADTWSVVVVYALSKGPRRFSELSLLIGGISNKMLTRRSASWSATTSSNAARSARARRAPSTA
jgi:pimeloyl-ACP methyl ester carboxylesterase